LKETAAKAAGTSENLADARLRYETRLVLSRDPTPGELAVLRSFFEKTLAMSTKPALLGAKLGMTNGSVDEQHDPQKELEALTAVGSVLFNLDAALTR